MGLYAIRRRRIVRARNWFEAGMSDAPDRQELLTALTTEHFTLQGARSQTVSESASRATLYVMAVSSALVGLGFIGQVSEVGDVFNIFALTVLPTLYVLGLFTFVRLVETSIEDVLYGRAINRIRHYYLELAGDQARLFVLSGHDDPAGVLANMALTPTRWRLWFTSASMIAVINSVVGGAAAALALGVATDATLGLAVGVGAVAAIASLVITRRADQRMHVAARERIEVLFPSPPSGDDSR
jgi:hypothetical protein